VSAQSKLLDRIYDLEQRNEALLTRLKQTSPTEREVLAPASKKRKANDEAVGAARKRAKTNLGDAVCGGLQGKSYDVLEGFEYVEEGKLSVAICGLHSQLTFTATAPFMRQLHALQQALQRRPSRSSIVLAAVDLCKSAEKAVLAATRETTAATGRSKTTAVLQNQQPDLPSVLHALERAYRLLCQGLNKLSTTDEGRKDAGQVTYHLVALFETVLGALRQHCKIKATEKTTKTKQKKKKQKQAPKSMLSKTAPSFDTPISMDDDPIATQITRTLARMVLSLSLSRTEQRNLLDGYIFVLLNYVGKTLCLFVFRDLQLRPDLRTDAAKLPLPGGLRAAGLDDVSLRAAEAEAKHLIWLLERTMAFVDTSVSSLSETGSEAQGGSGSGQLDSLSLRSRAKAKLQNTLLRAVFGEDDPLFKDCLRPPEQPDIERLSHMRACAKRPEKGVPEWFTQEVWRLLGWDVLVKRTSG